MKLLTLEYARQAPAFALGAALLFGASTPFVKMLVGNLPALQLAGLLYLGSGLGLAIVRLVRDRCWKPSGLSSSDWRWYAGAVAFGGIAGPALLVLGLTRISAGTASLLLNLEAVLTAGLAWIAFREHAAPRIVFGMILIVAGGVVLSWPEYRNGTDIDWGTLAIAGACLCWAIDNNLTRKVSASDALFIAVGKGLIAGSVNLGIASGMGQTLPALPLAGWAMTVGFFGYGVSLVLFVQSLRNLGTSRTGAYFSTAPFLGAALSIWLLGESGTPSFWVAAVLMAIGVWLHLTEQHQHEHSHEALDHAHSHVHDEHHHHAHAGDQDDEEPHDHRHTHEPIRHSHPHFPDIHHRHPHK